MNDRFLQIHFLTSYAATLLNRDDAGFAKRIPFGGAVRTRISSQCLKRHWRTFEGEHSIHALGLPSSVRSRRTFEKYVLAPLLEDESVSEDIAVAATTALMTEVLGESPKAAKAKKAKDDQEGNGEKKVPEVRTGQITVLGRPEVDYFRTLVADTCKEADSAKAAIAGIKERLKKEGRTNLAALKHASGLDAAMFGRMVTSDYLARGDAAIHVAHAFTVHTESSEADYFSAVDDLLAESDEMGSGHIGSTELTSGLFYGYVVVDIPLLVSNLSGCRAEDSADADRDLAARVVESLVHLIATVSPGAKLGSTAPYSYAHFLLAEAGAAQPRSLANAFLRPVRERPDLLANTYGALGEHLADLDGMYGATGARRAAGIGKFDVLADAVEVERAPSVADLADWCASRVRGDHD